MGEGEIVQHVLRENSQGLDELERDCRPWRGFIQRVPSRPGNVHQWDDLPVEFLDRHSLRLQQRLFWY